MKYDARHIRNPGTADSYRLQNYVTQNGTAVTVDARGRPVEEREVYGFRSVVRDAESSGMHTFSFTENIPAEDLIEGVRGPARDHLDGNYLIGIHEDTDHNHIHIGEAGSLGELEMSATDVKNFASDVADNIGVQYG